ncbi:MAG: M56 family metallopeptidase [Bradymonadaceae bacterium]|nr:M56 family metallopeptidase [Lujinxingiaceae bacterium]
MSWLTLVQALALTMAGAMIILALAFGVIDRGLRARLTGTGARSERSLTMLAALPLLGAAVFVAGCLFPALAALWVPSMDHCLAHGQGGHLHLCPTHLPAHSSSWVGWLVLGLAGIVPVFYLTDLFRRLIATERLKSQLERASQREGVVRLIEASAVICFVVGVFRPVLFVSRALWEGLNESERGVLVAHELAHIARRDSLREVFARLLLAFHLPTSRARLLEDLSLTREQACDDQAAHVCGDRLAVAQLIVRIKRMALPSPSLSATLGAASISGASLDARIEHLLDPQPDAQPDLRLWWAIGLLLIAIFAAAHFLHHDVEHLLAALY